MAAQLPPQQSVYSSACSRSPGCACPLCDMSANALLLATPQQKENRPPALPPKETRRKQPLSARPVVPAKVGAMPLQPKPPPPPPGSPSWGPNSNKGNKKQQTLRTASSAVGRAAVKEVEQALGKRCTRAAGCECPLCGTAAEALERPLPTVSAKVKPLNNLASKPTMGECTRSAGCTCVGCAAALDAMQRSPPPTAKLSGPKKTSSKDAPTKMHRQTGAAPRPRHPSGKPTITPIKARPQPTRGPGSEAAQAVLARIKAQAAAADAFAAAGSACPPAVAAARGGDEAQLLAALASTSTDCQWACLDTVLPKLNALGGVAGLATAVSKQSNRCSCPMGLS